MKTHLHATLSLLAVLLMGSLQGSAQYNRIDNATRATILSKINEKIEDSVFVGGAVGIVKNGEIVYMEGFGHADRENNIPADECTLFRIGSVAKTFTSIVALQLWDEGKFDMHQDIRDLVPSYPAYPGYTITPHLLLTHLSGITDATGVDANYWLENPSHNAVEAVETFKALPLVGSTTPLMFDSARYSNYGYNLMGAFIQQAAGQPYEQLIHDRIFRPLHMPRIQAEYLWRHNSNASKYYSVFKDGDWHTRLEDFPKGKYIEHLPCGGFISSVTDLCLFAKGFGDGSLLSTALRDSMKRDLSNLVGRDTCGYALYNTRYRGTRLYYTGGGIEGGSSIIVFSADFNDAVIIVANAVDSYGTAIRKIAFDLIVDRASIVVTPGTAYTTGPLPESSFAITTDKNTIYTKVANNITVNSTMESTCLVRLEGDLIRLLPGFHAESGSDFLAHTGNPNQDCMEQPGGILAPRMAGGATEPELYATPEVYPNPTRGHLNIRSSEAITSVEITDLSGRVLLNPFVGNSFEIQLDLHSLSPGAYLTRVEHNGHTSIKKIILTE